MKARHLFILALITFLAACKEDVDTSARYVFKDYTVYSYLSTFPQYSEYAKMLGEVKASPISNTTLKQLLTARGHYTCFAPTNDAIHDYLQYLTDEGIIPEPSWDAFPSGHVRDSIKQVIVYNSIIDGADEDYILTSEFPVTNNAELPLANMNDRKLNIRFGDTPDSLYVNYDCPIDSRNKDIEVTNGVIHCMHKVIYMQDLSMTQLFNEIILKQKEGFLVTAKVVLACGLQDTMSKIRDEVYERLYLTKAITDFDANTISWTFHGASGHKTAYLPEHRKYGFTVFAERDNFWREAIGKAPADITPADVQQWVLDNHQYSDEDEFTVDDNYTSPQNLLYQWITYHILPCKISADKLVIHNNEKGYNVQNKNLTIAQDEFYATMGKRRLIKLFESKESNGVYLNRFPKLDNGRRGTYHELYCDEDKVGCLIDNKSDSVLNYNVLNGIVYGIDAPLAYTDQVRNNLQRQRIRFESMTMFPEAMTNDIRKCQSTDFRHQFIHIPPTSQYQYFENMDLTDDTWFVYLNSYGYDWCNLNADELKAEGRYEVTLKLPPVPRSGVYELRYKVLANGDRGTAQFYLGTDKNKLAPTRIPIDLTLSSPEKTGWFTDSNDDDYNAEKDKQMRNNGIMKGGEGIQNSSATERATSYTLRHIVSRQFVDADKTYYLRIKSVLDSDRKEFYMDYLEWVSKEVYDNPEEPEDIW
ncbi:MAG: fasciclin domain-containing protein [Bacteroidaceae bacterium]